MSSAYRYLPHYTVADYQQWDGDWELWQGIPVSMSPSPFGPHQSVAMQLATTIKNAIDRDHCDAVVLAEIDWIVSGDTVVRPDVLVLCGDVPPRHVEQTPAVVAEILSPSTADRDRTAKFDLYRDEGVKYYLILDPDGKSLELFALDERGTYQQLEAGDAVDLEVCDGCRLHLSLAHLFR